MNPSLDNQVGAKRLFFSFAAILTLLSIYLIVSAVIDKKQTGILNITSSDKNATISVSAANTQAQAVGTGKASVRLKQGVYLVAANDGSSQAIKEVSVHKLQTTSVSLTPTQKLPISSAASVNYENTNALLNIGITPEQINYIEQYFYDFKPSAQVVVIYPNTIYPEAHNPNVDTSFTVDFTATIDNVSYKAKIIYSDLTSIQLNLYNSAGSLVFDSSNIQTPGGD